MWDGISDARITFSAADLPLQTSEMARMTENLNLQRGLLKHLSQIPEVQLLDNVRVTVIEKEDGANGWPSVRLSDGQTFRTRLLVSLVLLHLLCLGSDTTFRSGQTALILPFVHSLESRVMGGPMRPMLSLLPSHILPVHRSNRQMPPRINVSYPLDQSHSFPFPQPSRQWFGRPNLPWLLR